VSRDGRSSNQPRRHVESKLGCVFHLRSLVFDLPSSDVPTRHGTPHLPEKKTCPIHDARILSGAPPPFFPRWFDRARRLLLEALSQGRPWSAAMAAYAAAGPSNRKMMEAPLWSAAWTPTTSPKAVRTSTGKKISCIPRRPTGRAVPSLATPPPSLSLPH
jgi:hypothetical protein